MVDFQIIPSAEASVMTLMKSIDKVIINPIIIFMFALAMVYFLYGLVQYLLSPGNEEVHKKSKSVMLWGIIGLFIMTAVFGIMKIILTTVGENKIKINSSGDFVVDGSNLADRNIADNKNTGLNLMKTDGVDVSSVLDTKEGLPLETFITSPFPVYEADALCWNKALYDKGSTEYNALDLVKTKARSLYLKENSVLATDKTKLNYPEMYSTKVLYNKTNKTYYAWIDARAPKKTGTMANCNLRVLSPAKALPASILFSEKNTSTTLEAPNLQHEVFITSPFAKYEQNPLCWNEPISGKATTEFNALEQAKTNARTQYLKVNGILATDKTKQNYPQIFETKILFEKGTQTYYAWLDARAPIKTGTMSNCLLKVISKAKALPPSTLFSEKNTSTILDAPDLSHDTYITTPFATYKPNPLCWNNNNKPFYTSAANEYTALDLVDDLIRTQYLKDNGIAANDVSKINYPIKFEQKVLYEKSSGLYYAWVDARAPIKTGKVSDCKLEELTGARQLPESVVFSKIVASTEQINLSTTVVKSNIKDYTISPFIEYISNPLCWRKEVDGKATTEYAALGQATVKARWQYLNDNNLTEAKTPKNLPTKYGTWSAYDKVTKNYYVWWDVRAPIKTGTSVDCNLDPVDPSLQGIPDPTAQSSKKNPFTSNYASDDTYYRVIDSGVDPDYTTARNRAIDNALIQVANLSGARSLDEITSYSLLEEKYYRLDINTNSYDYWVVLQSRK